jgi:UDP-N-acetylmuramate dehydrogenase
MSSQNTTATTKALPVPNTLALPCTAAQAIEYHDEYQLPELQALFLACGRLRALGGASNVVLPPVLTSQVVLMRNKGMRYVGQTERHWLIEVAAGENWHNWVVESLARGWAGLENLALIPGTVGAAPIQNIGAYGVELKDRVDAVQIWDFDGACIRWLTRDECLFGYRDSVFKQPCAQHWLVLRVRFALPRQWQAMLDYPDLHVLRDTTPAPDPQAVFDHVVATRQAKLPDPRDKPNVGSFFKNPVVSEGQAQSLMDQHPGLVSYPQADGRVKLAAGWLVDQCGYKGRAMGAVAMHDRQALVMVNRGGATVQDVMALAGAVTRDVHARFGVSLEMEPSCW